jgi:ParB/RepB/Spo0J family partition protein
MAIGMREVSYTRIEVGLIPNCRKNLGDLEELAGSILTHGLQNPLVVIHKHYGGGGYTIPETSEKVFDRWFLVSGERRYRAIEILRKRNRGDFETVPVRYFEGSTEEAIEAQLCENIDRKNLTPVEEANGILELRKRGYDEKKIAKRLGRSPTWVSTLLHIRTHACAAVLAALEEGKITIQVALDLASMDAAKQEAALAKHLGLKAEKGKGAAARTTAADAGKNPKPAAKEVKEVRAACSALQQGSAFLTGVVAALSWALGDEDAYTIIAEQIHRVSQKPKE